MPYRICIGRLWQSNICGPHGGALFDSLIPAALRAAGTSNDLEQFARIQDWPIAKIRCPTLIIQGTADKDVPFAHAEYARSQIAGSELVKLEGADHSMFFTQYKVLGDLVRTFITKNR
jgi:pimeloyl-ACP methyl ester carboxylesterase